MTRLAHTQSGDKNSPDQTFPHIPKMTASKTEETPQPKPSEQPAPPLERSSVSQKSSVSRQSSTSRQSLASQESSISQGLLTPQESIASRRSSVSYELSTSRLSTPSQSTASQLSLESQQSLPSSASQQSPYEDIAWILYAFDIAILANSLYLAIPQHMDVGSQHHGFVPVTNALAKSILTSFLIVLWKRIRQQYLRLASEEPKRQSCLDVPSIGELMFFFTITILFFLNLNPVSDKQYENFKAWNQSVESLQPTTGTVYESVYYSSSRYLRSI